MQTLLVINYHYPIIANRIAVRMRPRAGLFEEVLRLRVGGKCVNISGRVSVFGGFVVVGGNACIHPRDVGYVK